MSVDTKSERIEVHATRSQKALLQRAAGASHKNVTEFLLEAGLDAAEEALVDRRRFRLERGAVAGLSGGARPSGGE